MTGKDNTRFRRGEAFLKPDEDDFIRPKAPPFFPEETPPLPPTLPPAEASLLEQLRGLTAALIATQEAVIGITGPVLEPFSFTTQTLAASATTRISNVRFGSEDRDIRVARASIYQIRIVSLDGSTDYDFEIYEAPDFSAQNRAFRETAINNVLTRNFTGGTPFINSQDAGELHFLIKENGGTASRYAIKLRYIPTRLI